jgi:hypothetical protein
VISSSEAEELNVSCMKGMGPKLLKAYLKYVKAVVGSQPRHITAVVQEINENVNTHVQQKELHFD